MASESSQSLNEQELRQLKGRLSELRQTEANFLERCDMTFIILVAIQMQFATSMGDELATLSARVKDDPRLTKKLDLLTKQLQTIQTPLLSALPDSAKKAISTVVEQLKEFNGYNFFETIIPSEEALAELDAAQTINILIQLNTHLTNKETAERFCRNLLSCAVLLIYEEDVYKYLINHSRETRIAVEKGASYLSKAGLQLLLHQGLLRLIELQNFSKDFERIFAEKELTHPGKLAADSFVRKMARVNRYANELNREPEKLKDKGFLEKALADMQENIIDLLSSQSICASLPPINDAPIEHDVMENHYSALLNSLSPISAFTLLSDIPNAALPLKNPIKLLLENADGYFIRQSSTGACYELISTEQGATDKNTCLLDYLAACAKIRPGQKDPFTQMIHDAFAFAEKASIQFSGPDQHLLKLEEGAIRLQLFRQRLVKSFVAYLTPDNSHITRIFTSLDNKITELTMDEAAYKTALTSEKLKYLKMLRTRLELYKQDSNVEILDAIQRWEKENVEINGEQKTVRSLMEERRARPFRFTSSESIKDILDGIKTTLDSNTYEGLSTGTSPKRYPFYTCGASR